MQYEHLAALAGLERDRLISRRKHPRLPLFIHNYTERAQRLPIRDWPEALKDCRGLILDNNGDVIGRAYRGARIVATRGSFESAQALWAGDWLDKHYPRFMPDATYLFEIVYPANRIVVNYGTTEELFLRPAPTAWVAP